MFACTIPTTQGAQHGHQEQGTGRWRITTQATFYARFMSSCPKRLSLRKLKFRMAPLLHATMLGSAFIHGTCEAPHGTTGEEKQAVRRKCTQPTGCLPK